MTIEEIFKKGNISDDYLYKRETVFCVENYLIVSTGGWVTQKIVGRMNSILKDLPIKLIGGHNITKMNVYITGKPDHVGDCLRGMVIDLNTFDVIWQGNT